MTRILDYIFGLLLGLLAAIALVLILLIFFLVVTPFIFYITIRETIKFLINK